MPGPLVSVVIPAHNGEAYLAQAIESVLAQTWPHTELLVVDDGSTDSSAEIAAGYDGVTLIRQENRGVAAARNRGAAEAEGELLSFLDQDDLFRPEKIERQLRTLEEQPEAGICACQVKIFVEPGLPRPPWLPPNLVDSESHALWTGTLLVKREAFERIGPYEESYRWANDLDWLVRARESGIPIAMLPEPLFEYRVHDHNESRMRAPVQKEALAAFRAAVLRKREGANRRWLSARVSAC